MRNRLYTGCLVQGKNRICSYKLQVSIVVPDSEWMVVQGTHEAIIPPETFEQAQQLFEWDMRTAPSQDHMFLLAGFMRCADCGRAMNRKLIFQPGKSYCYYICSTFKKMQKGACTNHTIRSDQVEQAVLETLRKQIELAMEMDCLGNKFGQTVCPKKPPHVR